jgi:CDP-glycerol glycerophosphotransferase
VVITSALRYLAYVYRLSNAVFLLVPVAVVAGLFRRVSERQDIWLIAERRAEARDNGYHFFAYLCRHRPGIRAIYAIDVDSPDFARVSELGETVRFGSLSHYWFYALSRVAASTHMFGASPVLTATRFVRGVLPDKVHVFLRHGIGKDEMPGIKNHTTGMDLIVCGAKPEYEYLERLAGRPDHGLVFTGLCRFDRLRNVSSSRRRILFMPTFRKWLFNLTRLPRKAAFAAFKRDPYWAHVQELINHPVLESFLVKHDMELLLLLHPSLGYFDDCFSSRSSRVKVMNSRGCDIQEMICGCDALITDFSSVFFDFAYLEKPVVYYQFDAARYRASHYREGYFSYARDGFGPVVDDADEVVQEVEKWAETGFSMPAVYRRRAARFFPVKDAKNTERVYRCVVGCLQGKVLEPEA